MSTEEIFTRAKARRSRQLAEMSPAKIARLRAKCFGGDRDPLFIRAFLGLFARDRSPADLGRIAANEAWYTENHPRREEDR